MNKIIPRISIPTNMKKILTEEEWGMLLSQWRYYDLRGRTLLEKESIPISEKHFSNETTKKLKPAKWAQVEFKRWFKVNPQDIDQSLFQKERKDELQEKTRKLILEAFAEVKSKPEKYGGEFKTTIPKNFLKGFLEINNMICKLGGNIADWVEQSLEWAQRICNGESWETICNLADTDMLCQRLVVWKNGKLRLVGGGYVPNFAKEYPPSRVGLEEFDFNKVKSFDEVVPLVVLRKGNIANPFWYDL